MDRRRDLTIISISVLMSTLHAGTYRTIVNGSLELFWGRDKSKANFFFCFAFLWVGTGDSQLLLALRSIKPSKGTGGQAGNYFLPFVERLRRGHLVIRLSAVTHLAQCRSEQLVSMSSPSRNSLNDSQADDVSICVTDSLSLIHI